MRAFLEKKDIEELKRKYPKGSRVEAVYVEKDPLKDVKSGVKGSVMFVDDAGGIHVKWDKWGQLTLIHGVDSCVLIDLEQ